MYHKPIQYISLWNPECRTILTNLHCKQVTSTHSLVCLPSSTPKLFTGMTGSRSLGLFTHTGNTGAHGWPDFRARWGTEILSLYLSTNFHNVNPTTQLQMVWWWCNLSIYSHDCLLNMLKITKNESNICWRRAASLDNFRAIFVRSFTKWPTTGVSNTAKPCHIACDNRYCCLNSLHIEDMC